MARVICIMGESGSGKTTAMRNLNPEETYYIDADKKGLSWRGWRKQYSPANKNYMATDHPAQVMQLLAGIHAKCPGIKNVVIDTINGIMVGEEMRRSKEKGYEKWNDLATYIYQIIDCAYPMREDLNVIFLAHTQTERDDSGYQFTSIKTNGRKLEKIRLESKFTVVLLAKCVDGKYLFETNSRNSTAKSPMGMFESEEIENDIVPVLPGNGRILAAEPAAGQCAANSCSHQSGGKASYCLAVYCLLHPNQTAENKYLRRRCVR